MQTSRTSRETILEAIRVNLPKNEVEHPRIPVFQRSEIPLKSEFELRLQEAGGTAHDVGTVAEAEAKVLKAKRVRLSGPAAPQLRNVNTPSDAQAPVTIAAGYFQEWPTTRKTPVPATEDASAQIDITESLEAEQRLQDGASVWQNRRPF